MPYRGPQPQRLAQVSDSIRQYAGQTAIWRQYISASAGVANAGFGSATYYREQVITAFFGSGILDTLTQRAIPAGMEQAGMVSMSVAVKVGAQDEIIWNGERYRIDSDPMLSKINGQYVAALRRGE